MNKIVDAGAGEYPAALPKPFYTRDFEFFYKGLDEGKLLYQRCEGCGHPRNPPGPMCPACGSLKWTAEEASGAGIVYSSTVHHHPPLPSFNVPHAIVLVDMAEGFRMVGSFVGEEGAAPPIGAPVEAECVRRGEVVTYRFKQA